MRLLQLSRRIAPWVLAFPQIIIECLVEVQIPQAQPVLWHRYTKMLILVISASDFVTRLHRLLILLPWSWLILKISLPFNLACELLQRMFSKQAQHLAHFSSHSQWRMVLWETGRLLVCWIHIFCIPLQVTVFFIFVFFPILLS